MKWLAFLFLVRTVFSAPINPDGKAVLRKFSGHANFLIAMLCITMLAVCNGLRYK